MSKDYYKILGIEKGATDADIKRAFRKLAHQHHPDKANGDEAKFKEINEAYQVLSNKEKRQKYDQFGSNFDGAQGFGGGGNPFGGFDFSGAQRGGAQDFDFDLGDIFGSVFGGRARGGGRSRRGADIEVDLEISLKEAVFGTSQTISIRKHNNCEACQGSGAKDGKEFDNCGTCNGTGQVSSNFGPFRTQTTCPECQGQGKIIKTKCGNCSGQGIVEENADIKIEIPAGIDNGQSIRLAGSGNSGVQGTAAGDLYVRVHVKDEPGFIRQDDDLITEYDIPFTLAALGGEIDVKTIDGQVKLKIPAGTPSGKQFILRSKGVGHLKAKGRGNQIVIVNVEVPTKLSKKQKELLKELDKEFGKKSWF